jgi:eukaryotic-like serine/threonine-protein kinase
MSDVSALHAREPSSTRVNRANPTRRAQYHAVVSIAKSGTSLVELCFRRDGQTLSWAARKRVHPQWREDPHFRRLLISEARLARLVRHPNVVAALDAGEDREGPFLVMEYVAGASLARLALEAGRARRQIPIQVGLRICREVAAGLHAAHEARAENGTPLRLVHRDVSPRNVLVGFDGAVRITDFGSAKALGNGEQDTGGILKGNLGYLSPEHLRLEAVDRRSDIFSLGATLFELLSGRRLYENRFGFEGTRRILSEPPPSLRTARPDAPLALDKVLFEMLAKQPAERPSTARDVCDRMESILKAVTATQRPLTVAGYMERYFAGARDRHLELLERYLARIDRRARPPTAAGIRARAAETRMDPARRRPQPPDRRRSLVAVVAVLAAVVALAAAAIAHRNGRAPAPTREPLQVAAKPASVEVVPLPAPRTSVETPARSAIVAPTPVWTIVASPRERAPHRDRARRPRVVAPPR